jgi:NAD(P)-dependent dehydrogenase (short-subunit alcohol dehydrogenase family)
VSTLKDRVCVVTGASTGIGSAIAAALAERGAAVVGIARRFAAGELAGPPSPGRIAEVRVDVTIEPAVADLFRAVGDVDVLINNAGVGYFGPVEDMEVGQLREMLDVHVVGSFLCTREALRSMKRNRRGHIVNVASTAAVDRFVGCSGYTAAKLGQLGLSRVLTEEARAYNVRVTSLILGAVDTPIWDQRPQFDRSKMLRPETLAQLVIDVVTRPALSVEEMVIRPPSGNL